MVNLPVMPGRSRDVLPRTKVVALLIGAGCDREKKQTATPDRALVNSKGLPRQEPLSRNSSCLSAAVDAHKKDRIVPQVDK